jgi:hypothetical protein
MTRNDKSSGRRLAATTGLEHWEKGGSDNRDVLCFYHRKMMGF